MRNDHRTTERVAIGWKQPVQEQKRTPSELGIEIGVDSHGGAVTAGE